MASARNLPISASPLEEMVPTWAISSFEVTFLEFLADFDARKLVAKDAVHLGQRTDFNPRQKAKGECRSRRLSCVQRYFFCLCLKERHSCVFEERFAGRRQFNAVAPRFIS
jgi:hypothetical protein